MAATTLLIAVITALALVPPRLRERVETARSELDEDLGPARGGASCILHSRRTLMSLLTGARFLLRVCGWPDAGAREAAMSCPACGRLERLAP